MKRRSDQNGYFPLLLIGFGLMFFGLAAFGVSGLVEMWTKGHRDDLGIFGKIAFTVMFSGMSLLGVLAGIGMIRNALYEENPK